MTTANTYPDLHLILLYTISCFCAILASCWLQLLIYHGTKTVTLAIIQLSEQEEIVQKDVCKQTNNQFEGLLFDHVSPCDFLRFK